jgi:hypothetical protein
MIHPRPVTLFFDPDKENVAGELVPLTREMIEASIRQAWWKNEDLKRLFEPPPPIDLDWHWKWHETVIDFEGRPLACERVAIVAGEGNPVQGAMMISREPVPSVLAPGEEALFVELLFTAPWNRPNLRQDGRPFLLGVGTELMTWAAWFSREQGYRGRLRLDGSPDQVVWYQRRGLQSLKLEPMLYENVRYTPMELPPDAAERLVGKWEEP